MFTQAHIDKISHYFVRNHRTQPQATLSSLKNLGYEVKYENNALLTLGTEVFAFTGDNM